MIAGYYSEHVPSHLDSGTLARNARDADQRRVARGLVGVRHTSDHPIDPTTPSSFSIDVLGVIGVIEHIEDAVAAISEGEVRGQTDRQAIPVASISRLAPALDRQDQARTRYCLLLRLWLDVAPGGLRSSMGRDRLQIAEELLGQLRKTSERSREIPAVVEVEDINQPISHTHHHDLDVGQPKGLDRRLRDADDGA